MPARRVIIIGLDGADDYIIRKLISSGRCPHIADIASNGFYGPVLSTIPPLTPPAWTTMLTGLNPGRHGVYDFIQPAGDGRFVVTNASRRLGATLFDRCLSQDAGVIDLFVPFTFPPPDDGGIHISGLGTPSVESDFIRPHSLRDQLLDKYPGLREIDPCAGKQLDTLASSLESEIEMKSAIAEGLMDSHDWRTCMVVFNATDLAQHFYLRYFDDAHPHYDSSSEVYSNVIADIYSQCDEFIGRCMEKVGDDGMIAIVSDHGCQPLTSSIAKDSLLKDILQSAGLLKIKQRVDDDRPSRGAETVHRGIHAVKKYTPHKLRHAFNIMFGGAKERISKSLEAVPFGDDIDWDSTRAFVGPGSYGVGVYVNLRGRFPGGIVEPGAEAESVKDEILNAIRALKLPDGRPLAAFAAKCDEIYWGGVMNSAADVIVLFNEPDVEFSGARLGEGIFLHQPEKRPGTDLTWSGTHSLRGIFGLWGKGVAHGVLPDSASLTDVAPTILHMIGLKVPDNIDGNIILEADREGRDPVYITDEGEICMTGKGLTLEQERDVYEKLKSVGYFH